MSKVVNGPEIPPNRQHSLRSSCHGAYPAYRTATVRFEHSEEHPIALERNGNLLLASLDDKQWAAWEPYFERVKLGFREEFMGPDDELKFLWFPEGGVHSQVVESTDGGSVDVAIVGREGIVGLPAVFGARHMATRTIAQMETTALRIAVKDFREHLHGTHPLLHRLERYAAASLLCLAQIAGCNRLHDAEKRLCRWLLMVRDRVGQDQLPMTHEFLALMLGTRRASVTEVAQSLQRSNCIRYERGTLTFLDVDGLKQRSCECYGIIEEAHLKTGTLPGRA